MNNSWKDYFYFTKAERGSAILLSAICTLLFLVPFTYSYIFPNKTQYEFPPIPKIATPMAAVAEVREAKEVSLFPFNPNNATREDFSNLGLSDKLINTIFNYRNKGGKFYKAENFQKIWGLSPNEFTRLAPYIVIENYKNQYEKKQFEAHEAVVEVSEPFPFSPNLASMDDFLRLGVPQKAAQSMINYRSKGGVFRRKEDVRKIYNFPPELYAKLESFIIIEENKPTWNNTQPIQNQATASNTSPAANAPTANYTIPSNVPGAYNNTTKFNSKKNFNGSIDINQSNPEQWQQLPGVGAGYARKIVGFRDKLGGFTNIEQVKETFGLPDSTFQKIKPFLKASPILQTININTATQEDLCKHPYCKLNHAKLIISYRDMHGKFQNADALKKVYAIQDVLPKLLPYLSY